MAPKMTFTSWQRSKLFASAKLNPGDPRLSATLTLTLSDDAGGVPIPGDAPFALLAAADVAALKPGAVLRTAPPPLARDAETTKLVHIDFAEPDLPWRYTPRANHPQLIRPWFALLVGTAEELQLEAEVVKFVSPEVLKAHPLAESHSWAHVQDGTHSRLVSPRPLKPQHEYVAVLVRAFTENGADAWGPAATNGVLHVLHSWRFWTGEEGDFETLAARLRVPPPGPVGRAKLHYPRPVEIGGEVQRPVFEVRGAISSLQPDLGRIRPETMNDGQLFDALRSLLPGRNDLAGMPEADKRALLLSLCAPVREQIQQTQADLDLLNDTVPDSGLPTREIISLPHYGRPWLPDPDAAVEGWPEALNDDPRFRGLTGLGTWMGVEGQEPLMDAAVEQAGALRDAASRISHLALGVLAAGGLWENRLPASANARLRVFGPLLGRMVATDGGTALSRVTGGTSPLPPALFSSAAQRLLRDGATHARHALGADGQPRGLDRAQLLDLANQPAPLPERNPPGMPSFEAIADSLGLPPLEKLLEIDEDALEKIRAELARFMDEAAAAYDPRMTEAERRALADDVARKYIDILQDLLARFQLRCEGQQLAERMRQRLNENLSWSQTIEEALLDPDARQDLEEALLDAVQRCMASDVCRDLARHADIPNRAGFCDDLLDNLPRPPRQEQRPIDLGRLAGVLDAALDPRGPNAPGRRRVTATIHGIKLVRLTPPKFPIGLDFPTWELLRQYDREWLLPGAGTLKKDSVTALQTNPAFIDAYMVGINTQFMNEMRWRDLAVDRTITPLRMFWGQLNYQTQKREADIQPLAEWAKAPDKDVGDLTHQTIQPADPSNATGSRLVLVFRSDLFRRYPSTLVYLLRRRVVKTGPGDHDLRPATDAEPDGALLAEDDLLTLPPNLEHSADNRPDRVYFGPTFMGVLTPEITFFCFDVSPDTLDRYWLILDEPPTELRFRNQKPGATPAADPIMLPPLPNEDAATFAKRTLDQPTRVAISGKYLEDQALAANP